MHRTSAASHGANAQTRAPGLLACTAALLAVLTLAPFHSVHAREAFDQQARQQLIEKPDGLLEHVKSQYNDISIHKRREEVTMSFRVKDWHYTESRTNLRDPAELPLMYSRAMTAAVIYPAALQNILMIGLGGGSISMYLSRFLPDARIDAIDIDPAVIDLAKKYFGIRETEKVRYIAAEGRAFVEAAREKYDLILLDAYDGGNVPSHLMTMEFYALVKERLTPGGAVASNLHDGTKLYASSLLTMQKVFGAIELYPSGRGEVIAIATNGPMPDAGALKKRAEEIQQKIQFRYSPVFLLTQKNSKPLNARGGEIITDAQAPKETQDQ